MPTTDGERVPVTEVFTMIPRIREALKQPSQTNRLRKVLREQGLEGYQSFGANLLSKGRLDYQTARLYALNPIQLELASLRQSDSKGFGGWGDE